MQVSKEKIPAKAWYQIWNKLMVGLMKSANEGELNILLLGVLSKNERIMMAKRLMIAVLDQAGWNVMEIAQALKLSTSTVNKFQQIVRNNEAFRDLITAYFPNKIAKSRYSEKGAFVNLIDKIFDGYRDRKVFFED